MYRSIVVPLDGSPFAEQAVSVALAIAERCGAKVTFTRAWEPASYRYTSELTPPFLAPGAQDRLDATQYLAELASRLRAGTTTTIEVAVLTGRPADAINEYLTSNDADLVVMSTHGLTGWSRAWIGSVADALVRIATVPILLSRPAEIPSKAPASRFACVVIPLDGSAESEQILSSAADLGAERFVLLRVERPVRMPVHPYIYAGGSFETDHVATDEAVTQARNYLTRMAEWLSARCPQAAMEVDVRVADQPGTAIVEAATDYDADLVALTTHARRGVRLVLGSVADKVLRGTHGSLLVLRPSASAEPAANTETAATNRIAGVVF
jgi:nucleotide-binding universal stress UspA family protein